MLRQFRTFRNILNTRRYAQTTRSFQTATRAVNVVVSGKSIKYRSQQLYRKLSKRRAESLVLRTARWYSCYISN